LIAFLNGLVAAVEANSVVLDVNGVGYRAFVPSTVLSTLPAVGGKATLHTVMAVREDDISLYGFGSPDERHVFLMLTSVTGVGPKVGLAMLSVYSADELSRAISSSDLKALGKIPGVGPKLAQRVSLELGEKMAELAFARRVDSLTATTTPERGAAFEDAVEALVNWGFSRSDSRKAAERAISASDTTTDTPTIISAALRILSDAGR